MTDKLEIADEMKEILNAEPVEKQAEETGIEAAATEAKEGDEKPVESLEQEEERRNRVSAKDRIRQFRRKLGDTERELQAAREELERLRSGAQPESKEPKREAYHSDEDYLEAVVDYRAELKAQKTLQQKEQEHRQAQQQAKATEVQQSWTKQQEKALQKYPDFREMETDIIEEIQDSGAVNLFDDILESSVGTELVAYFHKNPGELERVAALRPSAASREIGRLESKLASGPVKKTAPPPPPETIRGSATVTKELHKLSQEEYNRKKNGF